MAWLDGAPASEGAARIHRDQISRRQFPLNEALVTSWIQENALAQSVPVSLGGRTSRSLHSCIVVPATLRGAEVVDPCGVLHVCDQLQGTYRLCWCVQGVKGFPCIWHVNRELQEQYGLPSELPKSLVWSLAHGPFTCTCHEIRYMLLPLREWRYDHLE